MAAISGTRYVGNSIYSGSAAEKCYAKLSRKIGNFKMTTTLRRRHKKDIRNITIVSGKGSVLSKWKSQEIQQSWGGNGISEEEATIT